MYLHLSLATYLKLKVCVYLHRYMYIKRRMTSTLPLLYTSYYLMLLMSIIFIHFQSPIRFHGSNEYLYFCSPTLLVMMMKRRVRMEEWFPWGRASTCTRTWRRTCMPTRSRGCCGCGGFIRSVREGSSVTTWGV